MGGKKAVEKSREWEKGRRDRLNDIFKQLCNLLPDHDPSISITKKYILLKAAEYIKHLQEQNQQILKEGSENLLKGECDRLRKRVAHLLIKTKLLVDALRSAGVPIPCEGRKKKKVIVERRKMPSYEFFHGVKDADPGDKPLEVQETQNIPQANIAKLKNCCDKIKSPKNPLKEINSTVAPVVLKNSENKVPENEAKKDSDPSGSKEGAASTNILAAPILISPSPIIKSTPPVVVPSIQPFPNIERNILSSLGPGTLILADGRVVNVPQILPQIVMKPQPAVIVMQSCERKLKPILLKKADTKTTMANKAPIPAINPFRLESRPRVRKKKKVKKPLEKPKPPEEKAKELEKVVEEASKTEESSPKEVEAAEATIAEEVESVAQSKEKEDSVKSTVKYTIDSLFSRESIEKEVEEIPKEPENAPPEIPEKTPDPPQEKEVPPPQEVIPMEIEPRTEDNFTSSREQSDCALGNDFLRKALDRTFMPIIDDVRLASEFSSDLFNTLQVPTGGQHPESISPTAAFLLAFPLVSNSKNNENAENEATEHHTATPTTILQIGNIDPPSSELFQNLEFPRNQKSSDVNNFDIGTEYEPMPELQPEKKTEDRRELNLTQNYPYSYPLFTSSNDYPLSQFTETRDTFSFTSWAPSQPAEDHQKAKKPQKDKTPQKVYYNYPDCLTPKKKSPKPPTKTVNWMTTPDCRTTAEVAEPEAIPSFSTLEPDTFPDFCSSKKTNNYSWSPSKSLLPSLDHSMVIPSTLPTLVGDLALGTSEPYKATEPKKKPEKPPQPPPELNKKRPEFKNQTNFFSVSQLVDPKNKKQKLPEKPKRPPDKNYKRTYYRKEDPCMFPERNFMPNFNQWNEKRHYKGNYSAESLISQQIPEQGETFHNFNSQNYFQNDYHQNEPQQQQQQQQYQNCFNFPQSHFSSYIPEDYPVDGYNFNNCQTTQGQAQSKKRSGSFQTTVTSSFIQPQVYPSYPKSNTNYPATGNNTNTLTNFNLTTIFPEMNDQRGSSSVLGSQHINSTPYNHNYAHQSHS